MTKINERKWEFTGLTLDMFRCDLCQKLLVNPIRQIPEIGTVCHPCYQSDRENLQGGKRLSKLDKIIYHMCLTCPNEGCTAKLTILEFEIHKKLCFNALTTCLDNSCRWTGREDGLAGHFIEQHQENVIYSNSYGQFVVHIDNVSRRVYLFDKQNGEKYFCRIFAEAANVHPFKPFKLALYETSHSFYNSNKRNLAVMSINTKRRVDTMQLCVDRLSNVHVENIISDSYGTINGMVELMVSILPIKEQDDGKTVNELRYYHMLSLLECTLCKKTMREPIFECKGGHGFCESCTSEVLRCPICANALTNSERNFQMERMSSRLTLYEQNQDPNNVARISFLHN